MFKQGFHEKSAISIKSVLESTKSIINSLKGPKGKKIVSEIKTLAKEAPVAISNSKTVVEALSNKATPLEGAAKKWIDIQVNGKSRSVGQAAKDLAKWTFRDVTPKTLALATKDIALAPFKAIRGAYRGAKAVYNFPQNVRNKFNARRLNKMRMDLAAKGFTPAEVSNMIALKELSKMGSDQTPSLSTNDPNSLMRAHEEGRMYSDDEKTKATLGLLGTLGSATGALAALEGRNPALAAALGALGLTSGVYTGSKVYNAWEKDRELRRMRMGFNKEQLNEILKRMKTDNPIFDQVAPQQTMINFSKESSAKTAATGQPGPKIELARSAAESAKDISRRWAKYKGKLPRGASGGQWDELRKFLIGLSKKAAVSCPLGRKPQTGPGRKYRDEQKKKGKFVPGSQPGKSKREQVLALLKKKAIEKKG